jgi:hypothetical protein
MKKKGPARWSWAQCLWDSSQVRQMFDLRNKIAHENSVTGCYTVPDTVFSKLYNYTIPCIHVYIYIDVYIYIYVYMYIHIYTYIYIYTCIVRRQYTMFDRFMNMYLFFSGSWSMCCCRSPRWWKNLPVAGEYGFDMSPSECWKPHLSDRWRWQPHNFHELR